MTTYRPGVPSWIDLTAPDPAAAARFFGEIFGWYVGQPDPDRAERRTCYLRGRPVAGIRPAGRSGGAAWLSYLAVADLTATVQAVWDAGGKVAEEDPAGRTALLVDPGEATFGVAEIGAHRGAGLRHEPGTLRRNELETRRADLVIPFYHRVFGWELVTETLGGATYTEWHLHGDTVAGLVPMDDRFPADLAAHWMVYFDVTDTDATVARARELGATVHVPPTDTPPGRFCVLSEPQGAVFSVIRMN